MEASFSGEFIVVGYYRSEIQYEVLERFFHEHDIQQPTLLGNVMLLPRSLAEDFCDTFGIIFVDDFPREAYRWCHENLKGFYSIHFCEQSISQQYIMIEDVKERILFKLIWK